jgi:hypothetical protein
MIAARGPGAVERWVGGAAAGPVCENKTSDQFWRGDQIGALRQGGTCSPLLVITRASPITVS